MVASKIAELLDQHVTLDVEGIDRIYLNGYQPRLQYEAGVVGFFKYHRGQPVVSSSLMGPMSTDFVRRIEQFARRHSLEIVAFEKGQRKDDVAQQRLRDFKQDEGVVFIGKAQEKFSTFRTRKRYNQETGRSYPCIYRSTVMCNQYYFYILDRDFGPLFIKFSSYFPYTMRICLNGHEYAKRQLTQRGIAYEALDNGFLSCDAPDRLQRILHGLTANKIDAMVRKWLARLPHPFTLSARPRRARESGQGDRLVSHGGGKALRRRPGPPRPYARHGRGCRIGAGRGPGLVDPCGADRRASGHRRRGPVERQINGVRERRGAISNPARREAVGILGAVG